MVVEMNSDRVPTVMRRRSRTRPSIRLTGVTRSLWSLSQEIGSWHSAVLGSPSKMKIAYAGGNGLLEPANVSDIEVDFVVNIDAVRCPCGCSGGVEDVAEGAGEDRSSRAAQGAAPLDLVEDHLVFVHQGSFVEESFGQGRLDMANGFPVGGAEVGAKRKS